MTNRPDRPAERTETVHEEHLQKIAAHLLSLLGDPNDDTLADLLTTAEATFTPWAMAYDIDNDDRVNFREGMLTLALERLALNLLRYTVDAHAADFCSDHNIH